MSTLICDDLQAQTYARPVMYLLGNLHSCAFGHRLDAILSER